MNKSIFQLALASTLLAGVAQAAPFQNGSFEIGPAPGATFITLGAGDTSITGWEVTGAGIDYIGGLWQPADGSRSLDLSAAAAGGIQQTFDTVAGHNYQVTFSLAGNPSTPPLVKTVQVLATGGVATNYTFDISFSSLADMRWAPQTYTFTATGAATTLSFTSLDNTALGPALDNVVVTDLTPTPAVVTPVPTLSEWALVLLATALGALGLRGRRGRGQ